MSGPVTFPQHIRTVDQMNISLALTKIYKMSVAYIPLAIILLALGISGQLRIAAYVFGANPGANPIWISILWIITSALGIVTMKNNTYRIDTALPHLILVIISMLATVAGIVFVSIGIRAPSVLGYERFIPSVVVGCVMIIAYGGYIGCSIYQIVVFARIVQTGVFKTNNDTPLQTVSVQSPGYPNQNGEKTGVSY